jgi:hypothetical protein
MRIGLAAVLIGLPAVVTHGADLNTLFNPASGTAIFVSKTSGSNKNPGTREAPMKNLDKAISKAAAGDTILVAEGTYSGTFDIGYFESDKPLKLFGGFSPDFAERDVARHPTLLQPDNASGAKSRKPIVRFSKAVDGTVVDGFVFDMGLRNSYHATEGKPEGVDSGRLLIPPKKASGDNPTVTEACLSIPSAAQGGDVLIQNNVFTNSAKFAIQAGLRSGTIRVLNNVFVANRMAAVEIYGTCRSTGGPKSLSLCGEAEIAYNTVLFSWSRTKDFQDMGYGVRVMTKLSYDIHHNIIGGNIMAGVDHTRFNKDEWVKLDANIFFVNKQADLEYSPASNTTLNLWADQFEDLEFASAERNRSEIPKTLPVDKTYLDGFLTARYSEETDFERDSPANQWRAILGLNLQGTMSSSVTMYGNRYPYQKALELFGAVEGAGAQAIE